MHIAVHAPHDHYPLNEGQCVDNINAVDACWILITTDNVY